MGGPSKRAIFGCFFHYWYGVGWITSSAIAYLCPDWVNYSLVVVVFTLILSIVLYFLPPSIVYLFNARKYEQGQKALEDIAQRLDVTIPRDFVSHYINSIDQVRLFGLM